MGMGSCSLLLALVATLFCCCYSVHAAKIPVIIDTDIGNDFDDTWAVALALSSPELDIKLILSATGNAHGRAQILAKFLQTVGRIEVPVGVGVQQDSFVGPLYGWAESYDLTKYPGPLYKDGIQAAINIINNSTVPIVIIAIAPNTNIQQIIAQQPSITKKVIIKAMSGNIKSCMKDNMPCPEYNVAFNTSASQAVFSTTWMQHFATPIDTCGQVVLSGDVYQTLRMGNDSRHPVLQTLLTTFSYWCTHGGWVADPTVITDVLFDPVAVYMTFQPDLSYCDMSTLQLVVDKDGRTLVNTTGNSVDVCLSWSNKGEGLNLIKYLIVERLLTNSVPPAD